MALDMFASQKIINSGELDRVFLMMHDLLHNVMHKKEVMFFDKNVPEYELLYICYMCITNGVHPDTCHILMSVKLLEFFNLYNSNKITKSCFVSSLTVVFMQRILYSFDVYEFYARAYELCTPEVSYKIQESFNI